MSLSSNDVCDNTMMLQYTTCQGGRTTVQQGTPQPMQFSPWQFGTSLPQGIAWATPQPPTLLTTQNPGGAIFIRGTAPQDGSTPMFIQSPPPQTIHAQHCEYRDITQIPEARRQLLKCATEEVSPSLKLAECGFLKPFVIVNDLSLCN